MTTARACPVCGKPVPPRAVNRGFPFCSPRCRLLDLGQWLDGGYRIPGERAGDGAAGPEQRLGDDEDGEGAP
jgi:endogenous inhibitor of DNA gyrase (YacG/DUF329 family)